MAGLDDTDTDNVPSTSQNCEVPSKRKKISAKQIRSQWNLIKLYRKIVDRKDSIHFAEELGLLPTEKICRTHKKPMAIYTSKTEIGFFHCSIGSCKVKNKICRSHGTWFQNANISVQKIFYIMYAFVSKFSYEKLMSEDFTESPGCLSRRTIADWYNYCRRVIVDYFLESQEVAEKIGGAGRVVQIAETQFGRQNKDRKVDGHWVLGMIENGSEDMRLEVCPENIKTADVLIPLIQKHVKEGSIVHTNNCNTYDCLGEYGYIHKKVNRNPDKPCETENASIHKIQSQWKVFKKAFYNDNPSHDISDWLVEYQWRRNVEKNFLDPFEDLINAIRFVYGDHRKEPNNK